MPNDKPTILPYWTQGQPGQVAQPPTSLRNTGFSAGTPVPAEYFNQIIYELGQYVAYLDSVQGSSILATTLEGSMRLINGGTLGYTQSSTTLTWSAAFNLSIPSVADADNTLAAGSAVLPLGCILYVNANVPFCTTGDVTAGATSVANLAYALPIAVGQTVTGVGIPANTTVLQASQTTVVLSQAASATAAQTSLTFSGVTPLAAQVAPVASFVPSSNTVVLARGMGSHVFVGVNAQVTTLHDGEQKNLAEPGYTGVVRATAGQAIAALTPVYMASPTDSTRTQAAAYPTDASVAFGAMRTACVGFVYTATAQGAQAAIMTGGILPGFAALTPGASYWLDPASVGGMTQTKPTLSATPYVVRIGKALNATTLLVHPEHLAEGVFADVSTQTLESAVSVIAPTITSTSAVISSLGFRQTVFMGSLSRQAQTQSFQTFAFSSDTTNTTNLFFTAPFAGSVLALSVYDAFELLNRISYVAINNVQTPLRVVQSTKTADYQTALKGAIPFQAGALISVQSVQQSPASTNYSATAYVVIEMAA